MVTVHKENTVKNICIHLVEVEDQSDSNVDHGCQETDQGNANLFWGKVQKRSSDELTKNSKYFDQFPVSGASFFSS